MIRAIYSQSTQNGQATMNANNCRVLLVDDEEDFLESASLILTVQGYTDIRICSKSLDVPGILEKEQVDLILLDINMPGISGTDLLDLISRDYSHIKVVMVTAVNDISMAVNCVQKGASDYLVKPLDEEKLLNSVEKQLAGISGDNKYVGSEDRPSVRNPEHFERIITNNASMLKILSAIENFAPSPFPCLIRGETGTGKELMAEAIHNASGRKGKFIPVNVAGLDDNLFSDTLFGHVKGAFSGADQTRKGLIEEADGGTLFLDEIGDIEKSSQLKLLRFLQDGDYYHLGSDNRAQSNVRIVVASNADFEKLIGDGLFRADLFYRLKTHEVQLLPLRDRKDDLPLLVKTFIDQASDILGKPSPSYPSEIMGYLQSCDFPGNVRELQAILFDAVANHQKGILSLEKIKNFANAEIDDVQKSGGGSLENLGIGQEEIPTIKQANKLLVEKALAKAGGNQAIAARLLGITRQALNKRLKILAEAEKE